MKLPWLLLTLSLAANAVVGLLWLSRPTLAPPAVRSLFSPAPPPARPSASPEDFPPSRSRQTELPVADLWSSLATLDPATLVSRLRAAGFPPHVIRSIVHLKLSQEQAKRARPLLAELGEPTYWQNQGSNPEAASRHLGLLRGLERETQRQLRALVGDDIDGVQGETSPLYGNLPPEKIAQLRQIEGDYAEVSRQLRESAGSIVLPEDLEAIALLEKERQADLASLLTPEEFADYEARSSRAASRLRPAFAIMDATEEEFRAVLKIYEAYPEFNRAFSITMAGTLGNMEERSASRNEIAAQVQAALGPERYADFVRGTSREYRQLLSLTQQQNLAPDAASQTFALRETLATESQGIVNNSALTPEQKRAALQAAAQRTRAEILQQLGPTAGASYLQTADRWLRQVENGSSVRFGLEDYPQYQRVATPRVRPRP